MRPRRRQGLLLRTAGGCMNQAVGLTLRVKYWVRQEARHGLSNGEARSCEGQEGRR